ncbi:hypothetical protein MtrunA17_Chr7g0215271 [Medicago truncatula]|uniref:Uncharacterized protein n=1 Tax=Medicago truncatula TaxID=3880 RepID=A0A396GU41_MEDTR|nr:hypothetical protein MtrunA17_Chr7g0215271 [Medicago truncatula]
MWKNFNKWGIQSLGKGYYELTFSCLERCKESLINSILEFKSMYFETLHLDQRF